MTRQYEAPMTRQYVVVRRARGVDLAYAPGIRDGSIVALHELEIMIHHPIHPVVALPSTQIEQRGPARLRVYELLPLGN